MVCLENWVSALSNDVVSQEGKSSLKGRGAFRSFYKVHAIDARTQQQNGEVLRDINREST